MNGCGRSAFLARGHSTAADFAKIQARDTVRIVCLNVGMD